MKIIGIGNALLDELICLNNDTTLAEMQIKKGAMELIDEKQMLQIQEMQQGLQRSQAPGGSVCNTIRALAKLDAKVGYIGKIGSDTAGDYYEQAVKQSGVNPYFIRTAGVTGCSTILISPDGERTMATFLGPAATLSEEEISDEVLSSYDCVYIEGYLIANDALFLPILQRAKRLGLKIALDLSNFNIVNGYKKLLSEVIPEYVDILFSNESEAEAFTGLHAEEAVKAISQQVEISIVTIGKKGAWVGAEGRVIKIETSGAYPVDTTGAGDHFAAGFLYGRSVNSTPEQSAQIGNLLAENAIMGVGAEISSERWEKILPMVQEILL